jgi:hypothetical protein
MRSYSGTLLLENIFDFVPSTEVEIYNLSLGVFNPNVLIVEIDCKTTLGKFETVNYEAEGLTELATESRLSYDRINELLSAGTYSVATRHSSTCISKGGICKKCYRATYPTRLNVEVNDRVDIEAEYLANSEIVELSPDMLSYSTVTDPASYSRQYVFHKGNLLFDNVDYTISNGKLTLTKLIPDAGNLVIRFMRIDRSAFVGWLASSYSGSLLGMKAIPYQLLPMRPLFLASTLLENRLQLVSELVKSSPKVPKEYSKYIDQIRDPLEKALFMLAIYSIYYNVSL